MRWLAQGKSPDWNIKTTKGRRVYIFQHKSTSSPTLV